MEPNPHEVPARVFMESFRLLQLEMRSNALAKQIREFTGEGATRFKDWLADIERVGQALGADDERFITLAFQSLRGSAGEFLSRC